jgi:hypothetical protein
VRTSVTRRLAWLGALIAGPSFLLNVAAHGGTMPGPDDVDRVDGAFSVMFMAGAALVVAALWLAQPSPLGRKGRRLLVVESAMVFLGGLWAAIVIVDPEVIDSTNPIVLAGDASWPLHQVFMLIIGIVAMRGGSWRPPARYALFGPCFGLAVLAIGALSGIDVLAAAGLGSGWVIVAAGVLAATDRGRAGEVDINAARALVTAG